MFQSFDETADGGQGPTRLAALRAEMAKASVDAFVVPRADAHQGEYVADCDARLAWLTGFTGSAGFAAITRDHAGVFVDGRYRLQVRAQVADTFSPVDWPETQLGPWLTDVLPKGATVAFDPWLHTVKQIDTLRGELEAAEIALRATDNLVDAIWADRPAPPAEPVTRYPEDLAGRSADDKRADLAKTLREDGARVAVLTQPDGIAWLLNIRGGDLPRVPVALAFAVLDDEGGVSLFIDPEKLGGLDLGPSVTVTPVAGFPEALDRLTGPVRIDPETCPQAIADRLAAAGIGVQHGADPTSLPKACKTDAEIAATTEAHLRDGAAMCEFLAWLDAQEPADLTEIDVVTALEGFRRATNALRDIAFDTICGAGPNGAIIHYRVTEATNRRLNDGELLLVDSGGQYLDGTTDITRTIALGNVTDDSARRAFTRVLQGMIAVSRLRWPSGLAGRDLEAVARVPLWQAGQDFNHGTGHGVGVYMSVHEGPQRLSRVSSIPLRPGMILSNEPGFYRAGHWGIRLENLIVVSEAPSQPDQSIEALLEFTTLTYAPLDRRLVVNEMLSADERNWLNSYHAMVLDKIGPRLGNSALMWLTDACAPI